MYNNLDKLAEVSERGEGIISCSLAPYGNHDYSALLHDVDFLISCGLNQLLLLCYQPNLLKLAEIAPNEIRLLKRGKKDGQYEKMFFDNLDAIRENHPDLPVIATPMVGDTLCFGTGRFLKWCQEHKVDGLDVAHYFAIDDPLGYVKRAHEAGIHFIPAVDAMYFDLDNEEHCEIVTELAKIAHGELLFVGGVPGEAPSLDGNFYKKKVEFIRNVQKENDLHARIVAIGGMNTPEDAYQMVKVAGCDGIHFSSAFMKRLLANKYAEIETWLKEVKQAISK